MASNLPSAFNHQIDNAGSGAQYHPSEDSRSSVGDVSVWFHIVLAFVFSGVGVTLRDPLPPSH